MRRLALFLFLASIASAKEYRLLPPHVPMPKIVEAVPPPQTHVFAALDVNNAFTGNNTFSGTSTFTGRATLSGGVAANTFKGPSPWVDITDPQYGAKCDGATDDTTAIQNAINAVAQRTDGSGTYNGGTVFIPPGRTGACLVSTLNMDAMLNVTIMSPGFTVGNPNANSVPSIRFTGTCGSGACLSMKSVNGVTFQGIGLFFANATTGPMIDLGHCTVNCHSQTSDSAYVNFHSVAFDGPGGAPPTIGPIISIPQGEFIRFDGWSVFQGASIFVKGSPDNTMVTDLVTFDKVFFAEPGTTSIQNAGVGWKFTGIDHATGQGVTTNCIPFLTYTATNIVMQNLSIDSSEFNLGPVGCTNVFTLISTPNGGTNLGGVTFTGNLVLAPTGATNATAIALGTTQSLVATGNVFQNFLTLFNVGATDNVFIHSNIYNGDTNFFVGTPLGGIAQLQGATGQLNFYGGGNNPATDINGNWVFPFSVSAGTTITGGGFLPISAGGSDLGSTALPHANLWIGTGATNNFKFQPAATAAARIITIADPLSPSTVGLPLTIASGTSTLTVNAALAAVTSQAAITTAGTGILTTDAIEWAYASAPTAGDSLCHVSAYVTAGNVNFVRTNPTAAAQSVSALVINWKVVR